MNFPLINQVSSLNNFPFVNKYHTPYWIKIRTIQPKCIYYFGPFENLREAKQNQHGYIEDLIEEKAFGIYVEIKKCKPKILTKKDNSQQCTDVGFLRLQSYV